MSTVDLMQTPSSDPAVILRYRDRQYAADLIGAAILEFDFFSFIDQHAGISFDNLCSHFEWQTRPADVLLTLCRASGFIANESDGGIVLTSVGREFLTSDSQWFLGPYYQPIADSPVRKDFVSILRTGKPANWQAKSDGADWHESMKDETFARSFTDLMNCRGIAFGQKLAAAVSDQIAGHQHMLDVGGGSGIYSSTMVTRHPHLRATVLEQSPVDEIARKEIDRLGLSDQVHVHSADMFRDPWPTDVDVVLLSNLLHDWDVAEAQQIVNKAREALPVGGLIIIHGAIINAEKTGPLPVAEYSSLLMNITQGKCYSVSEYGDFLRPHGFELHPYRDTTGDRGFLTATKC
ncbi:2-polyprenyl-3-methyl-5-hydroxy-6-metoxy-1,4-benzoquinol methylase [Rhodopirellula rubra]|uniref:2-polyprenyl-3-methyl-5-hydroxy-6-metoxy-1, 4-benzoquinol methylase n=1 Tax=Aporhodopirellula rubra TaxID=980271 RepID=A0A7W5H6Q7_9BACT|nr:methyltransferase [Aporhodopirellula rubra]MBB3207205.1 2-polyprenyl-3-methyl-5-hydroxy-6-metoxy-1,4-benzoquinol methylase [Aporhodopirellula rubra]